MNQLHNPQKLLQAAVLILVIFLLGSLYIVWRGAHDLPGGLNGKWQAVFLTDGQAYFGKLSSENSRYVSLEDVYYLKLATDVKEAKNLNLIRLGGEAHGPENQMFIAKDQILFIENLKPTSTVVEAIEKNNK
ncbi:hypothetical protein KW800_00020 [Candidatus Parcubacteria bacterium]|nr:hypothetical protein [Candidatus Parcubacteria bacterium]